MTQKYHHPSLGHRRSLITAVTLIVLALLCTVPAAAEEPIEFSGGEFSSAQKLEEALLGAATRDGDILTLQRDINLVDQPIIITGDMTILGNGHTIYRASVLSSFLINVESGTLTLGSGNPGDTLTIDGQDDMFYSHSMEGSICVQGGGSRLVMKDGVTLKNSTTFVQYLYPYPEYGSAVTVEHGATFTMEGGLITQNTVETENPEPHGGRGAVNIDMVSSFHMSGGEISDNTVTDYQGRGGIGSGVYNWGTFTMTGGTISRNTATTDGGGVINYDTFELSGGTISNNTAAKEGGGVKNSATFTMSGGSISNNTATNEGGGVYNTGTFTLKGGTISNNTVTLRGGGVHNLGTFNQSNGTISGNNAPYGGGVYTGEGNTFNLFGGSISGNTANDGGGVHNAGTFTMTDGTISGNTVVLRGGGGVHNYQGTFTMKGGTISGNNVTTDGGGVKNSATFNLFGGTISGNKATTDGGGIENSATFTMSNGTISGNTAATNGGGVKNSGTFRQSGGAISDNTASEGSGVYNTETFSMSDGTITGNTAAANGGGVYTGEGNTFNLFGGTISGNTANDGGGVHNAGTFTMTDGTISGNTVVLRGGGVKNSATFNLSGGTISGNKATNGGGIENSATFSMSGGEISGNNVTTDGGGLKNSGTFTMTGGDISGNKATNGDELYHTGSKVSLSGAGNISGGTTYLDGAQTITLSGALTETGGIQNIVTSKPTLNATIITTNSPKDAETARPHFALNNGLAKDYALKVSGTDLILGKYTVTYHGTGSTGGTAPHDPNGYGTNAEVTIQDQNTLEKTGHTFTEWNTQADGNGTAYQPKATFHINEDTNLHAQWKPNVTTITLENNSQTFDTVNITYGTTTFNATPKVPSQDNHTFLGWYTQKSDGTQVINSAGDLNESPGYVKNGIWDNGTAALTLYAQWHENTLPPKITTTNLPDGSINTKYEAVTLKATGTTPITWTILSGDLPNGLTLSSDGTISGTPTKTGTFTFTVQAENADPAGPDTKQLTITITSNPNPGPNPPGSSCSGSGNMDNAFRVLFDTKGGSFISPVTSLSYGDTITQPPAPTKDGYTFSGWYKDEACTISWSFSEGIPGDITLYAKWIRSSTDPTPTPTTPQTTKPTTVPKTTKPTASPTTTATAAGGAPPTPAKTPAPIAGALLGLLAAGALLRKKDHHPSLTMTQKHHHPSLGLRQTLITAIALITLALLCTAPAVADTNTIGTPVITAHPQSSEYLPNTPCTPLSVSAEPPEGGTGTLSCQWQKSTRPDFADIELSPKQTFDKSTTYPIPNAPPGTTYYYRANISYTENDITTWVLSNYAAITTHHIPPQYTAYWFNTTTTAINLTLSPTAGNADSVYIKLGDKQSPARSGPFIRGITITNFPFSGLTPGQTYELTAYIKYQNTDHYTAQPLDPITAPVPDKIDIVPGSHGELPLSGESCIFPPGNTMTFSAVTQNNSDSYPNIFQNDPVTWNLQGTNTTIIAQTPTTITLKSGSTAGTDTLTAATQNGLLRSEPIPLIVDPDKVPTELRIEIAHPVPLGDTTYLVAAAFSEDDLLFLGYDLTVTGISLPTSKIPAILYFTPTEAKTISAAITVNGKKISSTTENVTVIDKPAITSQQTADAVYFESDTPNPLSVTVSSPGSGPLTYQWQKSTDPTFQANVWNIEGATTPTYTPTIQIPESGISPNITYYRAKITYTDPIYNMISTYAYSRIAKITVLKPTPDTITLNPSELTIEKGTTAHITAAAQNSTRPDLTCDHPIAWSIETGGEYLTLSQNKNEADITAAAEGVAVIRVTSGDAETRLTVIVTDASSPAQKHLITAAAGPGGTISPNGDIPVVEGTSQTFTIIPDRGYRIADVTVNGTSVGAVTSYTFPSVSQPYTIAAAFTNAPAPEPEPQPPQPPATSGSSSGNMDNAFRVLFDTSGGSFISPVTSLSYGDKITAPPAPTKDGCTFGGWYTDEACTQEWSFSDGIPGDITLYAKWIRSTTDPTPIPTAPETAESTPVPETTKPTTAPTTTTAAGGVTPTLTQAPAPVLGVLLGLLAAGALLRRRD